MKQKISELIATLFGQAGAPIRRDLKLHVTHDEQGNPSIEAVGAETFSHSGESIDRLELTRDRFYSCGCPTDTQIGGQCGECSRISCVSCFPRCSNPNCRKPLCRLHVTHVADPDGKIAPLCHVCADEFKWKAVVSRVTLGLLPPARI